MKKTFIALLAIGSTAFGAFTNTTWDFEGNLSNTANYSTSIKHGTSGTDTAAYVASGLTSGTAFGNYVLNADLGQAINLTSTQDQMVSLNVGNFSGSSLAMGTQANNSYSILTFVKFDSVSGEQTIFGTGSAANEGLALGLKNGTVNYMAKYKADHLFNGVTLTADTWYALALTYDYTTGTASLYVNGELKGTQNLSSAAITLANTGHGSVIGSNNQDLQNSEISNKANMYMAEFSIVNGAMTQTEILTAMHLTTPVPEPATGTLSLLALAGLCARRRRK